MSEMICVVQILYVKMLVWDRLHPPPWSHPGCYGNNVYILHKVIVPGLSFFVGSD